MDNGIQSLTQEKIKKVIGQKLSYKNLCQELCLPTLYGNSKIKQLQELGTICQYEMTTKPTRYCIIEIYPEAIETFEILNGNDKFQPLFEAALYQILLDNNSDEPLYVSNLDLMKLFMEVNENFIYSCDLQNIIKLNKEEYLYMPEMGGLAYNVLKNWTKAKIERMQERHIINVARGYRLRKQILGADGRFYTKTYNTPFGSPIYKKCATIYAEAYEEAYTEAGLEPIKITENIFEGNSLAKEKNKKKVKHLPKSFYDYIRRLIQKKTREVFKEEGYSDITEAYIISPPEQKWLIEKLRKVYEQYPALEVINEEACRKIMEYKKFSEYTLEQKEEFIKINMAPNPPFKFKQELKKLYEKQKEIETEE